MDEIENRIPEHLREHDVDLALVAQERGVGDASVAVLLAAGWRVVEEECIGNVRIRYLIAPEVVR